MRPTGRSNRPDCSARSRWCRCSGCQMRSDFTRAFVASAITVSATVAAQIADSPDDAVAGIAVNYTEAKVGQYTLPDPLTLASGEMIRDARSWHERRRPEIL